MDHPTKKLFSGLTRKIIRNAVQGEHIEVRASAAQAVGRAIREAELTESEREFAEKILTLICQDVSEIVRRALSVTLQNSPNLPRSIAKKLIADIDTIAAPILINSPVLTDADLVAVLQSRAAEKVKAIAQRHRLSAYICRAIISFGDGPAVSKLAANDSALISPEAAAEMAAIYADDDLIRDAALSRQDMPPETVQKLINAATHSLEKSLRDQTALSPFQAIDIANRTQQRALVQYVGRDWPEANLTAYIITLQLRGQLTEGIILRAAGIGDLRFVQIALAIQVNISVQKAGLMLFDNGPLGLKALCDRAGLSESCRAFLGAALAIYRDFQLAGHAITNKQMQRMMLERILSLPFEMSPEVEADLFEKLDSLSLPEIV